jgi:glycosyltransferase involved in cell wall biosynthesis
MLHESPGSLGGSERTLALAASALTQRGWDVHLAHLHETPPDALTPFASATRLTASSGRGVDDELGALLTATGASVAHAVFWSDSRVLAQLQPRVATVATALVPVCPNGARYWYAQEHICERGIGLGCLTVGYRKGGCGHTADGQPFGPHAMVRQIAVARTALRRLRACRAVIVPGAWQRDRLAADGVPADRLHVVAPPIDMAAPAVADTASDEPPTIAFAGRLFAFKGVDHLLRASAAVAAPHRIAIAGDGPVRPALEALTAELGLTDRVTFLGRQTPDQLVELYRRARATAFTSLCPETFGRTGPEAMVHGTPAVAYAASGTRDWLEHDVNGLAVAHGDVGGLAAALDRVASDPALAERLGRGARASATRFAADRHAAAVAAVYDDCC